MIFLELLDRLLQFIGLEFLERAINYVSELLTRLLVLFKAYFRRTKTDKKICRLVLLQRSDNFIIIDKPPDLLINSNDPAKLSVQKILKSQIPELVNNSLVHDFFFAHRLDFSTSGILCLPLNKQSCIAMSKSLEDRRCQKFYVALVNGHLENKFSIINLSIGEDVRYETTSKKMCTIEEKEFCKNPRKCFTYLVVVENGYYSNRPASKVMLRPVTGRRHQLRLHCQYLGHPIVGDYTYGTEEDKKIPRMHLHAIKLVVPNSVEDINVETDDPFNEINIKEWKCETKVQNSFQNVYKILEGVT